MEEEKKIPLIELMYSDEHLVVANKPSGISVHPGPKSRGQNDGPFLMKLVRDQLQKRVYPIHRLDRPVSGPVLFLLNPDLVKIVQADWHTSLVRKKYIALARKHLPATGIYDIPLDDKESLTHYQTLGNFDYSSLVDVEIFTGRMHQIRRHFSRTCNNIVGDTTHGKGDINTLFRAKYELKRIFLHCYFLTFPHPISKIPLEFHCPLPSDLINTLDLANHLELLKLKNIYPQLF